MDGLVKINLGLLYPPFAAKILELQTACAQRGAHFYMTQGLRTMDEQAALYAQGRTKPGNRVTNAKPGSSLHNFGIAVDFTLDADLTKPGLQPDWQEAHYAMLGEEARKLGLVWGGDWHSIKDNPHVEWNLAAINLKLADIQKLEADGGLDAVWAALGG
jgi:peptidoglycan L-alanyl-D-glutamate endopeptidase CwlK